MPRKIIELKTLQPFFDHVYNDAKPFEVRKADRDYEVGDLLILREWDGEKYGEHLGRIVTYILPGGQYGIAEDYCVIGMRRPHHGEAREFKDDPRAEFWGLA